MAIFLNGLNLNRALGGVELVKAIQPPQPLGALFFCINEAAI